GQSEMLAFAWDVQTNTRNSSVVINPHKGYTGGRDLTDLRQIYENNANVISRRVREAILADAARDHVRVVLVDLPQVGQVPAARVPLVRVDHHRGVPGVGLHVPREREHLGLA